MASSPTVKNYVPDSFVRIDDPTALQKFLVAQFKKISNSLTLTNQLVQPGAVIFAAAPATPTRGQLQPFTDSTTITLGATITGGGTHFVTGHWNGSNWTVAAA